jgi:hypothetical protein
MQWQVGDVYPFAEDTYLELKGMKAQHSPFWSKHLFDRAFAEHAGKVLSAFVNAAIIGARKPIAAPRVVFGVVDKELTIHGVWAPHQNPNEKFNWKMHETTLLDSFKTSMEQHLKSVGDFVRRLLDVTSLQLIPLRVPAELQLKHPGHVAFLVVLSVDLDLIDVLRPVSYRSGRNAEGSAAIAAAAAAVSSDNAPSAAAAIASPDATVASTVSATARNYYYTRSYIPSTELVKSAEDKNALFALLLD